MPKLKLMAEMARWVLLTLAAAVFVSAPAAALVAVIGTVLYACGAVIWLGERRGWGRAGGLKP